MREFRPSDYGPVLAPLVSGNRCRSLDHGQLDRSMAVALQAATIESAFAHAKLADRDMAAACLAGAWLVHDFLDESHTISQNIDAPTGAFWHGVMHRREGDFSNAKYWFRRAGRHDVFDQLAAVAAEPGGSFDPFAFVDACQAALRTGGPTADRCRRIQQDEWELLFDFCYRWAVTQ